MPYIHWELPADQRDRYKMVEAISLNKEYKRRKSNRAKFVEFGLLKSHIDAALPLHIRRTLDQYFYTSLKSTTARDDDQVVYRYAKNVLEGIKKRDLPIMMVDQLWLLMLYDGMKALVIFLV